MKIPLMGKSLSNTGNASVGLADVRTEVVPDGPSVCSYRNRYGFSIAIIAFAKASPKRPSILAEPK
jgi:hypothetical protein